ncbi:MAG: glycoside hydrolase family 97 protein [Bacteroidales bacterium]|nr:glycoside hydrolase family 97 protein [Bacteroidales bacterium]
MKNLWIIIAILLTAGCSRHPSHFEASVPAPDGPIMLSFRLSEGVPSYMIYAGQEVILDWSPLGFILEGNDSLAAGFVLEDSRTLTFREVWQPVWGQFSSYINHYNSLRIRLREASGSRRLMEMEFRVFSDGLGFRYIFPEQEGLGDFRIMDELTGFHIGSEGRAWWIPGDWDSYEHLWRSTPVAGIDSANTPVTLELDNGYTVAIHEAALTDYAGMTLRRHETKPLLLECALVPWPDGVKVYGQTPFMTPWRTIQLVKEPGALVESGLILNLNEPSRIADVSWIRPMKYIGIWWGMHLGVYTWHAGHRHGATTERARQYIDFAASHDIDAVLVEGWNTGWESWFRGDQFDFVTPYPDFDLREVAAYAREKGVSLIGHHETGGQVPIYEKHIDSAFALYRSLGIDAVKTGYAGMIRPEGQHHHGQWMVRHYRMVVEKAAEHRIMIDAHEPIKPTGISRTWPNMMTREGVRGMEWNAWSEGNPPEHTTILPFTRMLGGPLDYTPGIFDIRCERYQAERKKSTSRDVEGTRVHTTLAKQLALYVVLFSPLQMAADMIENYENQPAFAFIERVPVTWDETRVLDAAIGDFVCIARRSGNDWYIGGITDERERTVGYALDFLRQNQEYRLLSYGDGEGADYETHPLDLMIREDVVTASDSLKIWMARGGGFAAILERIK